MERTMRYHNITKDDMLNGDGLRVVLWVSGCLHHCEGCQNPCTWNPDDGLEFDEPARQEIFEQLDKDYIDGITFSGGDPLHPSNRDTVAGLIREIKKKYPGKTVWLYTGYKLDYKDEHFLLIRKKESGDEITEKTDFPFELVDIAIDDRFDKRQREKDIEEHKKVLWKGSSNQKTIEICETLKENKIVERKE